MCHRYVSGVMRLSSCVWCSVSDRISDARRLHSWRLFFAVVVGKQREKGTACRSTLLKMHKARRLFLTQRFSSIYTGRDQRQGRFLPVPIGGWAPFDCTYTLDTGTSCGTLRRICETTVVPGSDLSRRYICLVSYRWRAIRQYDRHGGGFVRCRLAEGLRMGYICVCDCTFKFLFIFS